MLLVRETMYCKPGKVRPMVEKFLAMKKLNEKMGLGRTRILTDFAADRYWMVSMEMEVESLKALEDMFEKMSKNVPEMKEFEDIMKGYHDLIDHGRREIFTIEG